MTRLFLILFAAVGLIACGKAPQSQYANQVVKSETRYDDLNIRDHTQAPMQVDIALQLDMSAERALDIALDFENLKDWVKPTPKVDAIVDNSDTADGEFGVGTVVTYKEGESDEIVAYKPGAYAIAKPLWKTDVLLDHRGVVLVKSDGNGGAIVHFRRYFEAKGFEGWMMSKMMPMFMKNSAKNLIKIHGGEILHKR
ncbi:MAG: SRPBCC family protein [Pseudomonadota bacterium]